MFARQFSIADGKIEIIKLRNMMISPEFILELQKKDSKRVYELSKKSIEEELKHFKSKISIGGPASLNRVEEIYEVLGYGKFKVVDLDTKKKRSVVNIYNSPIAESYKKNNKKKSKKTQCDFIAGKISGVFSFIFNKKVEAKEVKCLAKGDDFCQFVVK